MQDDSAFDPALDDRLPVSSGAVPRPEPVTAASASTRASSASTVDDALSAAATPHRVLHSDPHDFAGLYIRHRASFTLHARRYLRDGRDADEVVQEAFLRLFLALPELETELQALAYCRRTITNLCIDRYRAQARRPSLVDLDSVAPEELADDDPGDPVVRAEDAAIVREAMSMLSPLHRAALVKREIEEKPLPLIAEELDVPEESVKHLLFRARRALRRLLAGTSLAPGSDSELAHGLGRAARVGSGGMAGFLLVLALGLGTGPDLRAIPVVGTDLPDLIPVTSPATGKAADVAAGVATGVADGVAKAVNAAVTQVTGAVKSVTTGTETTGGTGDAGTGGPAGEGPQPLPAPSPSASRTPGPVSPQVQPPMPLPPGAGRTGAPGSALTGGQPGPSVSPSPGSVPSTDKVTTDKAGTDRATTDKAGTVRTGTDRATTDRAGTDRAGTDSATTDKAGTDRAGTDKAGTDRAGTDRAGTDRAGTDRAGTDRATTDRAGTDRAPSNKESSSSSGKASPSADPAPPATSNTAPQQPAAPTVPADKPVVGPEAPPAPPAAAPETPVESAPAPVVPQTKAERKAAKKLDRKSEAESPKLTRKAPPGLEVRQTPAEAISPTSIDLPAAP